jgi:hypothetical protein
MGSGVYRVTQLADWAEKDRPAEEPSTTTKLRFESNPCFVALCSKSLCYPTLRQYLDVFR